TRLMKSCCVKRFSADLQKCGFSDRKFSGVVCRLVKLQRPPPEMRIFSAGVLAWSIIITRRPRRAASIAHIIPAAPAPITRTSVFSVILFLLYAGWFRGLGGV